MKSKLGIDEERLSLIKDPEVRALIKSGEKFRCECCQRFAKLYKRPMDVAMCLGLVKAWKTVGTDVFDTPVLFRRGATGAKTVTTLKHWGLVRERGDLNEQRAPEDKLYKKANEPTHYWEITPRGEEFVQGISRELLFRYIYMDTCFGQDGPPVFIMDVFEAGKGFDYEELMK